MAHNLTDLVDNILAFFPRISKVSDQMEYSDCQPEWIRQVSSYDPLYYYHREVLEVIEPLKPESPVKIIFEISNKHQLLAHEKEDCSRVSSVLALLITTESYLPVAKLDIFLGFKSRINAEIIGLLYVLKFLSNCGFLRVTIEGHPELFGRFRSVFYAKKDCFLHKTTLLIFEEIRKFESIFWNPDEENQEAKETVSDKARQRLNFVCKAKQGKIGSR